MIYQQIENLRENRANKPEAVHLVREERGLLLGCVLGCWAQGPVYAQLRTLDRKGEACGVDRMQADTRAIVWLRVDDPGASAKHIVVDPCGTEKYIKA